MDPGCVDRSDPKKCHRVPGSMSNHQCRFVSARDPTLIQFRALSCFCHVCLGYSSQQGCHQSEHVQVCILASLPLFTFMLCHALVKFELRVFV